MSQQTSTKAADTASQPTHDPRFECRHGRTWYWATQTYCR